MAALSRRRRRALVERFVREELARRRRLRVWAWRVAVGLGAALLLGLGVAHSAPIRHSAVVRAFLVASGYPHGRPGMVADHTIPLCAGGPDTVANLQWQEVRASYVKDAYERALCRAMARQGYRLVKLPSP